MSLGHVGDRTALRDTVVPDDDGGFTIWFGPEAPEGQEANWIQTVPGKSWFPMLRLYGPLEAWFDKTWRPGESHPHLTHRPDAVRSRRALARLSRLSVSFSTGKGGNWKRSAPRRWPSTSRR